MSDHVSDNVHLLAGAYALNALPQDERAFYERHLAMCDICQVEVAEYAETAARMGAASALAPPEHLRASVLAAVDTTRQDAPADGRSSGLTERLRPVLLPVAAGLAAVAVSLGGVTAYLWEDRQELAETEAHMIELLARAERVSLEGPSGVSAGFLHSQVDDEGMLVVDGLEALDDAHDYQLWLFHDGVPVPAGTFAGGEERIVTFVPEAQITGAEVVAVTVEPAGGLDAPTGEVVLSGEL